MNFETALLSPRREFLLRTTEIKNAEDARKLVGEIAMSFYLGDILENDFHCLMTEVAQTCQYNDFPFSTLYPFVRTA
jgi:hypothetical protein